MSFLEVNLTMEECLDIREQDGYHKGLEAKTIETATKMKEKGFEYDVIEEITGLCKEEIEKL